MRLTLPTIVSLLIRAALCQNTTTTTALSTIYSCAPEVTNCPYKTTAADAPAAPNPTSTILVTEESTIYSCSPDVDDCPLWTRTSTLVSSTSLSLESGAVVTRSGVVYSVIEAVTVTFPCASCLAASLAETTITVTSSECPATTATIPVYPEADVSSPPESITTPTARAMTSTTAPAASSIPAYTGVPFTGEANARISGRGTFTALVGAALGFAFL